MKAQLAQSISQALPNFAVRAGGDTSIDIYRRGDDKAQALRMLSQYCDVNIEKLLLLAIVCILEETIILLPLQEL